MYLCSSQADYNARRAIEIVRYTILMYDICRYTPLEPRHATLYQGEVGPERPRANATPFVHKTPVHSNTTPPHLEPIPEHAEYTAGRYPSIDLRPLAALTQMLLTPCADYIHVPNHGMLEANDLQHPAARYVLNTFQQEWQRRETGIESWTLCCDGSYYESTKNRDEATGWGFSVSYTTSHTRSPFLVHVSGGPVTSTDLVHFAITKHGNDVGEAVAMHYALLYAAIHIPPGSHITLIYDSTATGKAAEGIFNTSANTKAIGRASRGIVHRLQANNTTIAFQHTYSHEGQPLNELVDGVAKAGAQQIFRHQPPSVTPWQMYDITHPLAEWVWLVDLSPTNKSKFGFPYVFGNYITCPLQPEPELQALASYIQPRMAPSPPSRNLQVAALSYNCRSLGEGHVAERFKGINAHAGKAYIIQRQLTAHKIIIAGMQETHSKQPSAIATVGDYLRVIPPAKAPDGSEGPDGDVEIWVNIKIPCDPTNHATTLKEQHLQVIDRGPRYFLLSITAPWIAIDVLCGHAPQSWTKDAQERADIFWRAVIATITKRKGKATPRPMMLLIDANNDIPKEYGDDYRFGEHQAYDRCDPYAHYLRSAVIAANTFLPSTFEAYHSTQRTTHEGLHNRRIDFVCLPIQWKEASTVSKVLTDFDHATSATKRDHFPVMTTSHIMLPTKAIKLKYTRMNTAWIAAREPEALQEAIAKLQLQPVPSWQTDVHLHRHQLQLAHQDCYEKVPAVKVIKMSLYATDQIIANSQSISAIFSATNIIKGKMRQRILRVIFRAWTAVPIHPTEEESDPTTTIDLTHIDDHRQHFNPYAHHPHYHAWCQAISTNKEATHTCIIQEQARIALAKTQKKLLRQAVADFFEEASKAAHESKQDLWDAIKCLRTGSGGRRVNQFHRALPSINDKEGQPYADAQEVADAWVQHFAEIEGGNTVGASQIAHIIQQEYRDITKNGYKGSLQNLTSL